MENLEILRAIRAQRDFKRKRACISFVKALIEVEMEYYRDKFDFAEVYYYEGEKDLDECMKQIERLEEKFDIVGEWGVNCSIELCKPECESLTQCGIIIQELIDKIENFEN